MTTNPRFNYIITIHNKEDLITEVITAVMMCCRENSHIYPVLDGCSDGTEAAIDRIVGRFSGVPMTKLYANDVHELRSINVGLRAADQSQPGYNIVLQDDVVLADFALESKIRRLYEWAGERLAYVSLRVGANFTKDAARSNDDVPYTDYVENAYGHGLENAAMLLPGYFARRSVPIKSPVCIPCGIVRSIGLLDERLAPYGHDDPEYALRLLAAGYTNGVFGLRFYSDIKWGGTRTTPHPEMARIVRRNMNYIREWHGEKIEAVCRSVQGDAPIPVPGLSSPELDQHAIAAWTQNQKALADFTGSNGPKAKIKSLVKRVLS